MTSFGGRRDPFVVLGLSPDASADEIRAARRSLAKSLHPDVGGDAELMQRINAAAEAALVRLEERLAPDDRFARDDRAATGARVEPDDRLAPDERLGPEAGFVSDVPSFTVEALPVETFEALLLVAAQLGEVADDDPPYVLHALLDAPIGCWCRLDVVPDAGASTVSVTIARREGHDAPSLIAVRDAWITGLNALDWAP